MTYRFVGPMLAIVFTLAPFAPNRVFAHCDTMDGPVVKDAMAALESRDATPVLKWVAAGREAEIRQLFAQTLAVRALGKDAQALADRLFFETVVRVHREGEGAPFTGLKPAGTPVDPAVAASDEALVTGSVDVLAKMVTRAAERGLRERYLRATAARAHAAESVVRGREYVAAYVAFVHYAERLMDDAASEASHHGHEAAPERVTAHH